MTNDEFYDRVAARLGVEPEALEVAIRTVEVLGKVSLDDGDVKTVEGVIRGEVKLRREIAATLGR